MIFISYGLPKSASSFVCQMTRSILESMERTGRIELRRFGDQFFDGLPNTSFAEDVLKDGLRLSEPKDDGQRAVHLDCLFEYVSERLKGRTAEMMIIKTHLPCSPKVADAIKQGTVLASATFRHPAEMILSRRDMANRDGTVLPKDLRPYYKKAIAEFHSWADLPQVRKYYYDDIALMPGSIVGDILKHVGAEGDPSIVLEQYLAKKESQILQFNKGVVSRASNEMSAEELRSIEDSFSDFIDYIKLHKEKTAAAALLS